MLSINTFKKDLKKVAAFTVLSAGFVFSAFGESSSVSASNGASSASMTAFIEGCQSYSRGEWETAIFSLRKAIAYSDSSEPDIYYMLISSEMFNYDYASALDDCDTFLESFPNSIYAPRIKYFKGKNLFLIGDYERAIIELSDYCHYNQNDELYPYSLYYIAESLYSAYKYDDAAAIYERIIEEYPDCERVSPAMYRLESIAQRSREEKLLYLLKQTGEEYLSAKEEYEKQLRMYNSDTVVSARQKLTEAQQKNEELENQIRDLEIQISALRDEVARAEAERQAENLRNQNADQERLKQEAEKESEDSDKDENQSDEQIEEPLDEQLEDKEDQAVIPEKTEEEKKKEAETAAQRERREQLRTLREKALEAQRRFEEQQTVSN